MQNFFIEKNAVDSLKHYQQAYDICKEKSLGALVNFNGIIRDDGGVSGLSFDVYEPILRQWFKDWEQKAKENDCFLYFAHSVGDVMVKESSYFAAVMSKHRKKALAMIGNFVEDFKQNAPIWKYDIINGQRVYAKDRSFVLNGAGYLKP